MSLPRALAPALLALLLSPLAALGAGCRSADPHAPHAAPGADADTAAEPNRDRHGMADVERYIEVLGSESRVAELRVPEVVAALALPADAVVADIGCGPGVFALPFARACPDGYVLAVDVEPRQLDALRERLLAEDVANVVPVLGSYSDPHLPPGRVDLIFVADTYHHLEDRVAYFERLARALAPGGRLALVEYLPGDLPVGPPADHKLPAGVREAELGEAGWRLERRFELHRYHAFDVWVRADDPVSPPR